MFTATLMGVELYDVLWFFFIFCVLGVVLEMIFCYASEGVIESRVGLLYLPFSPIYGLGGVALSLFLKPYIGEPVIMFLAGMAVGSVLEYTASFVLEKAFHSVFWDYSDKPLNLHGRICFQYSLYWGFLSLLLISVLDRWVIALVDLFPRDVGNAVLTVCTVVTVLSTVLTLAAFRRLDRKTQWLRARRGGGEPQQAPAGPIGHLVDRLVPDHIMINTFPRMNLVLDYMELSGQRRRWIRWDAHFGRSTEIRERMRQHSPAAAAADST